MKKNRQTSNRLNVNAGIMGYYVKELQKLPKQITKECTEDLAKICKKGYPQISFDESLSSQARIALNKLYEKYESKFSDRGKVLAQSLMNKINKYATGSLLEH